MYNKDQRATIHSTSLSLTTQDPKPKYSNWLQHALGQAQIVKHTYRVNVDIPMHIVMEKFLVLSPAVLGEALAHGRHHFSTRNQEYTTLSYSKLKQT